METLPTDDPARRLAQPVQVHDLAREAAALKQEEPWRVRGHNARTLAKDDELRIVLAVLKQGARLKEHRAEETVSIHALSGRIRLRVAEGLIDLGPGQVLVLARGRLHDVEAVEESAFLLTVPHRR